MTAVSDVPRPVATKPKKVPLEWKLVVGAVAGGTWSDAMAESLADSSLPSRY